VAVEVFVERQVKGKKMCLGKSGSNFRKSLGYTHRTGKTEVPKKTKNNKKKKTKKKKKNNKKKKKKRK